MHIQTRTIYGTQYHVTLDDSTQFANVYRTADEKIVGTLTRRRVIERGKPEWSCHNLDGKFIMESNYPRFCLRSVAYAFEK